MKDASYRLFGSTKCKAWKQYLEALWLSGLRLEESFALSWDEGAAVQVVVSGTGRRKVARFVDRFREPEGTTKRYYYR